MDASFTGRRFDLDFLNDIPQNVDPCGENGEFHTFVYDGPIFNFPIAFHKGDVTFHTYAKADNKDESNKEGTDGKTWDTGFWFCDLQPTLSI